jgi:hypothetical protein
MFSASAGRTLAVCVVCGGGPGGEVQRALRLVVACSAYSRGGALKRAKTSAIIWKTGTLHVFRTRLLPTPCSSQAEVPLP